MKRLNGAADWREIRCQLAVMPLSFQMNPTYVGALNAAGGVRGATSRTRVVKILTALTCVWERKSGVTAGVIRVHHCCDDAET